MNRPEPDAASRFLDARADAAKAEMRRTFSSLVESASLDARTWVGAYPYASLATAAIAGFVAAPRRRRSRDEKRIAGPEPHSRFRRILTLVSLGLLRSVLRRVGSALTPALRDQPLTPGAPGANAVDAAPVAPSAGAAPAADAD